MVPAAVVLAIGAGAAAPTLSSASSPPTLAPVTAQQLVSAIVSAKPPQMSGQLTWTANLGLGGLTTVAGELGAGGGSGSGGGFSPLAFLNGSYEADVWLDGAKAEHLAISPQPGEELDVVRNGNQAWTWDSNTMKVQHFTWAARSAGGAEMPSATQVPETPQQVAQRILAAVGKTTRVSVAGTNRVGGLPTYEMVLTPKQASGSTVAYIEIDVAAGNGLRGVPLQVAVYANGQAAPALELGFSSAVRTGPPPANELTFSTPPGATVVEHQLGGAGSPMAQHTAASRTSYAANKPATIGSGWATVLTGTTSVLDNPKYRQAFDATTTIVDVGSQQARLFSSSLLNLLVFPDGRYFAGFVTSGTLAAAAQTAGS